MAEWPQLDELKQVLDVTSDDWDGDYDGTRLTRLLASAIEHVKRRVGSWDEYTDVPDDNLAAAALRAAQLMAPPQNRLPEAIDRDPIFNAHLYGQRRRFGLS
jgi:hypothetical protein